MERCAGCGKQEEPGRLSRCLGCKAIRYCSRECQKRHWPSHKVDCRKAKVKSRVQETGNSGRKNDNATVDAEREITLGGGESSVDGPLTTCQKCGGKGHGMKKCGQCEEVTYCSRDCQRADWKVHKVTCQELEVITTDGFRQAQEKEQAERRAKTERERVSRTRQHEFLSALLGDMRLTPPMTWDQARARAKRLYPKKEIVDKFRNLDNDVRGRLEARKSIVVIARVNGIYPHFFRQGRCLEDSEGMRSFVLFYNSGDPMPFFSYGQLRDGNFICYENGHLHFFLDGTVGFRVDDPSKIHVMEPSS